MDCWIGRRWRTVLVVWEDCVYSKESTWAEIPLCLRFIGGVHVITVRHVQ